MSKYILINDWDGNYCCELDCTHYSEACEEALEILGWRIVEVEGDEDE